MTPDPLRTGQGPLATFVRRTKREMLPRISDLSSGALAELNPRCSRCALLPPPGSAPPPWSAATEATLGLCGMVAVVEQRPVGYLLVGTPEAVAACRRQFGTCLGTAGFSTDAVVLIGAHVDPGWRGLGVGRQLVRGLAGRLRQRRRRGIEAAAGLSVRFSPVSSCARPPSRWFEAVGFELVRDPVCWPRWRLDVAGTVVWRPALGRAWQLVSGLVRPAPGPETARDTPRGISGEGVSAFRAGEPRRPTLHEYSGCPEPPYAIGIDPSLG